MIRINGIVTKGEGAASGKNKQWNGYGSIYHQVKFLKRNFPLFSQKIENCEMSTLNITLEKEIFITKWKYVFDKVYWLPSSNTWFEKLAFIPILFIFKGDKFGSWIYKAYKSPHGDNNFLVEVISPFIQDISYGDSCEININGKYIE